VAIALPLVAGILTACHAPTGGSTVAMNTLQGEAILLDVPAMGDVRQSPTRLALAVAAEAEGDHKLAVEEYRRSILENPSTAEAAINGLVRSYEEWINASRAREKFAEESSAIKGCYQALHTIKNLDGVQFQLTDSARALLLRQLRSTEQLGRKRAMAHLEMAMQLRDRAKGWFNDDEDTQMKVIHSVNLTWSYYPTFVDEIVAERLVFVWSDMKDELSDADYSKQMAKDRACIGCTIVVPGQETQ
jgi:tetratricopeptide (TPR) repeat protein